MPGSLSFSAHAKVMMQERMIEEDWIISTVQAPDMTEIKREDEIHYIRQTPQNGGKFLRVIINPIVRPPRVITVFFDRRVQP
ncbi:MAG: DUF4258 domain-containing protein [Methanoregula sp.]|jgi:hypothetical protein